MARVKLALTICCLAFLWTMPHGSVKAASPTVIADYPLIPLENPGFVRLTALTWHIDLRCSEAGCAISSVQTYQLHNRDRVQGAKLRLGLPTGAPTGSPPRITLGNAQGAALAPSNRESGLIWEVELGQNEKKTLVVSAVYQTSPAHFLQWVGELPSLIRWGSVDGVSVILRLAQPITDDAFSVLEPKSVQFNGQSLLWEYENVQEALPPHQVVMLLPDTWQQLSDLGASTSYEDLARLHLAIQEEARQAGILWPDHYAEILAALQAATQAYPRNIQAHSTLAQLYRSRAEMIPELRLNYLLLAAQELLHVVENQPQDTEAAEALSRAYYDAALAASEEEDPAGALAYLEKAQVPGSSFSQDQATVETLTLRWAEQLAEQGQVTQAIIKLADSLSPQFQDALLRYAPPLVSARTEVVLSPTDRISRYQFQLYPLSAGETTDQLQQVAMRAQSVSGCQVNLALDANTATLEFDVHYNSLAELRQCTATLSQTLAVEPSLIATLVAAPWQSSPQMLQIDRKPWRDRAQYRERVDLASVSTAWDSEAQFIGWRLVELQNTTHQDERTQLEQRLVMMVLREQQEVWESLPSASYWVFRIEDGDTILAGSWLLDWGQRRDLSISRINYHWDFCIKTALIALALVVIGWGILRFLLTKRPRK